MANPQPDIFTRFSNELIDAYITASRFLSPYENTIWLYIFRRTYGFHKKEDWIALKQIEEQIGIRQPHVARTKKKLLSKNMIIKNGHKVGIQKNYEEWNIPKWVYPIRYNIPKQVLPKQVIKLTQTGNKNLPKQVDTKESIKENNKRKEKGNSFSLKTKAKNQPKGGMANVLANLANNSQAAKKL